MLHGVVVRSPHAHATVELDVAAARAVPGVHAVLSAADETSSRVVGRSSRASRPMPARRWRRSRARTPRRRARPSPRSRPRYQQLGFVVDPAQALAEQRLQEDPVEDETGDVEAGMGEADVIVEGEYATSAQVQHALEPHCAVAQWLGDELHAFISTQGIYDARAALAKAFDLDPDRVHVTCEFMGGGFGAKQGATTEGLVAAYLSRAAAGRAVRVFNDRHSEAIATGHRASTQQTYRIGARSDGTLTAIEITSVIANPMRGWVNPTTIPARTLYRCANVRANSIPLKIDVEPSNAFRAPGVMEGTFGYESAIDELAAALSLDPLALRRANDIDVDQDSGLPYTAKNLSACIDRAAELAGWAERDALRDREHPDGRVPGPRRRLPDLVGRRRPARARARAHGPRRPRHRRDRRAGHRHRRDHGVRDGRRGGARPAARPRARGGRLDALRRLRARLGRLADDAVGRARRALPRPTTCAASCSSSRATSSRSRPTTCGS